MGTVVMYNVVSADGYTLADEADDVGPLCECYPNGDTPLGEGGGMIAPVSADVCPNDVDSIGSIVIGRHVFDMMMAGERTIEVTAVDVGGQALALGPVDEVAMNVVPVVFGSDKPYFGSVHRQYILEDPR